MIRMYGLEKKGAVRQSHGAFLVSYIKPGTKNCLLIREMSMTFASDVSSVIFLVWSLALEVAKRFSS